MTAERKTRAIGPDRPLFAGPGPIEIVARCESVRFDGAAGRGAAGFSAVQGGLSWWPSRFLRFMGDVVVESYDDPLLAPEPGRRGPYVSLLARAQVHIPRASPHASEP